MGADFNQLSHAVTLFGPEHTSHMKNPHGWQDLLHVLENI